MYKKWSQVLTRVTLFNNISEDELSALLGCLCPRVYTYKKNECIAAAGEKLDGVGIVLAGNAAVSKENADGKRVIMAILKPGDMFGEIAAFSENAVWPAMVYTQDECSVIFLPAYKIVGNCEKLCSNHRVLIMNMLKIVANKALMLNRKVEYLAIKGMREKIGTFLLEQYKKTGNTTFMLPMSRNELADFLNVSRPSMSREMGRMKSEGIIDFHRASFRILNVAALRQIME